MTRNGATDNPSRVQKQGDEVIVHHDLTRLIYFIRDQRVILDSDLARIYGVETRVLNQAVKRNQDRFPVDFLFELTREEILRMSQTVISLVKLKFSKQVRAFTEHGALMAATVLNSPRAVRAACCSPVSPTCAGRARNGATSVSMARSGTS